MGSLFGMSISRVKGTSLGPKIRDGSFVLFRGGKGARRGDVVLVEHPQLGRIVKKVYAVSRKGDIYLDGLSSDSKDAEIRKSVPRDAVVGVKVCKLI